MSPRVSCNFLEKWWGMRFSSAQAGSSGLVVRLVSGSAVRIVCVAAVFAAVFAVFGFGTLESLGGRVACRVGDLSLNGIVGLVRSIESSDRPLKVLSACVTCCVVFKTVCGGNGVTGRFVSGLLVRSSPVSVDRSGSDDVEPSSAGASRAILARSL